MKLLVDSDFWYGLVVEKDAHHEQVTRNFRVYQKKQAEFLCLKLVIYETVTVLSRRIDQKRSLIFLEKFNYLPVTLIELDQKLENRTWDIFKKQTKKGTSFVDCANLAVVEHYKLDGILSFNTFYPSTVRRDH